MRDHGRQLRLVALAFFFLGAAVALSILNFIVSIIEFFWGTS